MGFYDNYANPQGEDGKIILAQMNESHRELSEWGLSFIEFNGDEKILDIGCGGGGNINRFLNRYPNAIAYGVDISDESVKASKDTNEEFLGIRCEIKNGSAEKIPYEENTFDVVMAIETVYFWKDLEKEFKECHRVLKEEGKFIVILQISDPNSEYLEKINGMKVYSIEELESFFSKANFRDIKAESDNGRICIYGIK